MYTIISSIMLHVFKLCDNHESLQLPLHEPMCWEIPLYASLCN